jgi:hypothetical protein
MAFLSYARVSGSRKAQANITYPFTRSWEQPSAQTNHKSAAIVGSEAFIKSYGFALKVFGCN